MNFKNPAKFLFVIFLFSLPAAGAFEAESRKENNSCSQVLGVRNGHRLVYDSKRKKTILFGGADASRVLGDLWEWRGKKWRCVSSGGSIARTFPAMAYDIERRKIVMFGGNRVLFGKDGETNTILDDTWEWDGRKWLKIEAKGPPARSEAVMVYDPKRKRTVLFGGYFKSDGKNMRLGDTWEYDGRNWTLASEAGPSPRSGSAAVYDKERGKVILFGGNGLLNDTWEWDGKSWNRIETNDVPGRFNAVMAFDSAGKKIVRFGGWNGSARIGDTWLFDGKNWERLNVAGPEPRNHSAAVYDSSRKRVVLFGGHDGENVFGDTWEWDGKVWFRAALADIQKRVENYH
jgi:hypothetical protein